jgi:DNA-binding Lrp family transcriptional regulator
MEADGRRRWTLLTSHGHVLVEIARNPQIRVREISAIIGITERATQAIIADLEQAGYVQRVRMGRRTHYVLNADSPFRHSAQDGLRVGPFLELLTRVMSVTDGPVPEKTLAEEALAAELAVPVAGSPEPIAAPLEPIAAPLDPITAPLEPAAAASEPLEAPAAPVAPVTPVAGPGLPEAGPL